jgi:long-chain fatty acid transport protein
VALQYRGRQSSYYFSFTTPYTLENKLEYNLRFSETDTIAPTDYTREIDVPLTLATGMNFRFHKRNNVMLDLQWRSWDGDVENIGRSFNMETFTATQNDILAAVGFQRDGSPLFYDKYWDRITYRCGAWYKGWYIDGAHELGGSIGAGFPLGRKGTTVDLAFQGGKRFVDDGRNWEETFIGVRLGLMGIGNWGSTAR